MDPAPTDGWLRRLSWVAAGWALLYAAYRAYYGLGGTLGIIGVPADEGAWRAINLAAAVPLLFVAVLPLAALRLRLWHRPGARRMLLGVAWVIAVGCVMHGAIDETTRLLSMAGALRIHYPPDFWISVDRHAADLQDVFFNEPWFLGEGLVWAAIGWTVMGPTPARRGWVATAIAATVLLIAVGLLSAFGAIGRFVVL